MLLRENIHKSGDYFEVDIFPIKKIACGRSSKLHLTSETQRKLNERNVQRRLTWIIQENFTPEDVLLTLTYPQDVHITPEQGRKDLENYLRRIRYALNKQNIKLKYISKTEIGTLKGRVHHHVIISGDLGRDYLEQQWKDKVNGIATTRYIEFYENGVSGLAEYITKDNSLAYRSYNCSKNLKRPEAEKQDGRITIKKLQALRNDTHNAEVFERLYPGYRFVKADPFFNEYFFDSVSGEVERVELPYINIKMYKKDSTYIRRGFR